MAAFKTMHGDEPIVAPFGSDFGQGGRELRRPSFPRHP